MNLDDMLKEASIIDHSWYENGLSTVVEEEVADMADPKPNNIKNELEVEWGNGGPVLDLGEDIDVVKRNIPEGEDLGPRVVMFARECMNRGMMGKELISALKGKFDAHTMTAEKEELKAQLDLQGFVGCVAIDGRGYNSCKEALASAENSPYKDAIKCVIGCSCGDAVEMPVTGEGIILAESSGNSMDDFMASEDVYKPESIACCCSTMLPIVSAQSDIDEEYMAPSTLDLMNVTGLPEGEIAAIEASEGSWKDKAKKAFKAAYRAKEAAVEAPYKDTVDASEYKLTVADNEIEIEGEPVAPIEVAPEMAEVIVESSEFTSQDVDMGQEFGEFFAGSDEVQVDDMRKADAPLDVDMRADMVI